MFQKVWELKRFQTAKVTFKVIQGHWQLCHSIGYIRFPIGVLLQLCLCICTVNEILLLIYQNLKRSHAKFEFIPFWGSISCMHEYSSVCISTQNSKCLASPIPKIRLRQNLKKRVTSPWPCLLWGSLFSIANDIFYLHTKFGDSCFSRSADIIARASKLSRSSATAEGPRDAYNTGVWQTDGHTMTAYLASTASRGKIGDVRPISCYTSQTVEDRDTVTMDH